MSTIFIVNMNIVEFSSHMFGLELIESLVLDRDLSGGWWIKSAEVRNDLNKRVQERWL